MKSEGHEIDFSNTMERLRAAGAFTPYENPMDATHIDPQLTPIRMPGDTAYNNGPMWLQKFEVNLPEQLIKEQRKSFVDAINIYFPTALVGRWMHQYFADDFLNSHSYRLVDKETRLPKLEYMKGGFFTKPLDDKFSFKLDIPERAVRNRQLFTYREMETALKVLEAHPELTVAMEAYQAAFVGMVMKMEGAVQYHDDQSNPAEKEQATKILESLRRQYVTNNFMDNFLPAIALYYNHNHGGDLSAKPTKEDISEGMKFAWKNGAFVNDVKAPDRQMRGFSCPAKSSIMLHSANPLVSEDIETNPLNVGMDAGAAISHIHDRVAELMEKDDPAVAKALESAKVKAQVAQSMGRY